MNSSEQLGSRRPALRDARSARGPGCGARALAVLLTALAGCSGEQDANTFAPPPPPQVVVALPEERDVTAYKTYTGVVEASETVDVRARVQGFLEEMNFRPGQRVKKGDVLFVIEKSEFQSAVDRARAEVRAQRAAFEGADADARLARELADQRAGPEIDAVTKAARRDSIAAEIARAEAELESALLDLSYCDVVSPIDGRVTRNYVDVGNLVGRNEPTLMATIVQATPAYVYVSVNEADVLEIRREHGLSGMEHAEPGQLASGQWRPSEVSLGDEGEFAFKGEVDYVEPRMDEQTGTLRVRTAYDNADEALLPGLFARVRFAMSSRPSLMVPEAALLSDQQGRFALVVNDADEVEVRRVKIGVLDGPMRVVEEGLGREDRVVVLGVLKARPGSKVTPQMQEPVASGR